MTDELIINTDDEFNGSVIPTPDLTGRGNWQPFF